MSEYLKTLLDRQAMSVTFTSPDLETITRAGDRRIRRRAAAVVAGVAVVALFASVVVVLGGLGRRGPEVGSAAESVSWAVGETIHVGTDTIDVGHVVRAYVRTSVGFVAVDDNDDVYSVTTEGVRRIGHLTATLPDNRDQQRLVSDRHGTLVGWVGEDSRGSPVFETYDQLSGETRSYPAPGALPRDNHSAVFFAIDDRMGYWRTANGVYAVDLNSGGERLITGWPTDDFEIYSVEDGMLAFSPNADTTFFAGRSVEGARELRDLSGPSDGSTDPVRLSPTGAWLSLGVAEVEGGATEESIRLVGITPEVYDTATGKRITLDIPGDPTVAMPNVWLDDTTLQVLVAAGDIESQPRLSLYTCTLPDASCELASVIGSFDVANAAPVLPDGRWYGP